MWELVLGLVLGEGEVQAITAEAATMEVEAATVILDLDTTPEVQVEVPVLRELLEEN